MIIPTEFPTANTTSPTDVDVQGNLLREYDQKFAELLRKPEIDQTLLQRWFLEEHWQRTILRDT